MSSNKEELERRDNSLAVHAAPVQETQSAASPNTARPFIPLEVIQAQEHNTSVVILEGPLPPPELIEGYNRIHPGAAEIIFESFQNEIKHRHKIEMVEILTDQLIKLLGLGAVISIAIFGIWIGAGLIRDGHDWAGSSLVVTALGTIIGGIIGAIKATRAKQENIESKEQSKGTAKTSSQQNRKGTNRKK